MATPAQDNFWREVEAILGGPGDGADRAIEYIARHARTVDALSLRIGEAVRSQPWGHVTLALRACDPALNGGLRLESDEFGFDMQLSMERSNWQLKICSSTSVTPMHVAVEVGIQGILTAMASYGTWVDIGDSAGNSPLQHVFLRHNRATDQQIRAQISELMALGANPGAKNQWGGDLRDLRLPEPYASMVPALFAEYEMRLVARQGSQAPGVTGVRPAGL